MTIPFTQYLRPDGRRKTIGIKLPDDATELGLKLIDAGFCFTAEILSNGRACFYLEGANAKGERDDLDMVITRNTQEENARNIRSLILRNKDRL